MFERVGLPFAPIRRPEDLYDDPHLPPPAASPTCGCPTAIAPGRRSRRRCSRSRWQGERLGVRLDPPRMGEHTRELLRSLGYDAPQIDATVRAARGRLTLGTFNGETA